MAAIVLTSTVGLSHDEWLKFRNMGIGGSDASVVCGVNKYKSPIELWLEKTGQSPSQEAGESAYWGTRLEDIVREEFSRRKNIKVIKVNQILRSKQHPFMIANLDGVCLCPTHGKCVFEAKTASAFKASEWEGNLVPQEYILQIQHYLCVTGYNGAYIAVLIGGNKFDWKYVPRDEEIITMLLKYERGFWMHVQDGVPPGLDGSDACSDYVKNQFPNSVPLSKIKLPDSAIDLIQQYVTADKEENEIKKQKQKAANELKQMLGDHEIGVTSNGYVKWKGITQNKFDAKLFEEEQPEIHEKYKVESSYRRFTVKKSA